MPRTDLYLPQVDVDPDAIRRKLRELERDGDEAGNDWSWLSESDWTLGSSLDEFVDDLFVICRNAGGIFGEAEVDGCLITNASEGPHGCLIRVLLPGPGDGTGHEGWNRPALTHSDYAYLAAFAPQAGGSALEAVALVLEEVGRRAQKLVQQAAEGAQA